MVGQEWVGGGEAQTAEWGLGEETGGWGTERGPSGGGGGG